MNKQVFRSAFRVAAFGLCLTGILLTARNASSLRYYTVQSNILCLAFWAFALVVPDKVSPRAHGAVTLAIVLTGIIYNFVLVPAFFSMSPGTFRPYSFSDLLVHTVTPVLMVADNALFTQKGRLKWFDPLWWAVIPFAYFGYTLVIQYYPYFFSDPTKNTTMQLIINILVITVAYVGMGYLLYGIDRLCARKGRARA